MPNAILSIIFVSGLFIRFYHLGTQSIWVDEAWLVEFSKVPFVDIISGKFNQPIMFIILKLVGQMFGYTEASIRFIPALAGAFLILSSYKLGRCFFDIQLSLLSAVMVAISPIAIAYSQEAGNYSILMLIVSLYLRYFLLYMRNNNKRFLFYFGVFALIANYLHIYNIFILSALLIYITFIQRGNGRNRAVYLAIAIILVLSVPVIIAGLRVSEALEGYYPQSVYAFSFPKLYEYVSAVVFSWLNAPFPTMYVPHYNLTFLGKGVMTTVLNTVVAYFLFAVFLWSIVYNVIKNNKETTLLVLIVVVYCGLAVFAAFRSNQFAERYFLVLLPLIYILMIKAFLHEWKNGVGRFASYAIIVIVLAHFIVTYYQTRDEPLWKQAQVRISANYLRKSINRLNSNEKFAILVPINYETPLVEFCLPDLKSHILWDNEYQSYLYNPKMFLLKFDDQKRYNLRLLTKDRLAKIDVLYVFTERGRDHIGYITEHLAGQFRLDGVFGEITKVYTYRRY